MNLYELADRFGNPINSHIRAKSMLEAKKIGLPGKPNLMIRYPYEDRVEIVDLAQPERGTVYIITKR